MTKPVATLRRIGFLYPGKDDAEFKAWKANFIAALAEHEWVEGTNLSIDWRFAAYDQSGYASLSAGLARASVDVLATAGTPLTRALKLAAPMTPIVTEVGDPVGSSFAASLQRPGGTITGLSRALREKASQQFDLLLKMMPTVRTLLVLRSQQFGDLAEINQCIVQAARDKGLKTEFFSAADFAAIETALANVTGSNSVVAVAYGHGAFQFPAAALANAAIRHRVATLSDERGFTEAGCLMSFSTTHAHEERCFAFTIDRILRGGAPADIPFELPNQTELAVNLDTAASLGLEPPASLLREADVIVSRAQSRHNKP